MHILCILCVKKYNQNRKQHKYATNIARFNETHSFTNENTKIKIRHLLLINYFEHYTTFDFPDLITR